VCGATWLRFPLNVLQAAAAAGVGTFVNISTDKAANPICVLGYSKRVAERVTADFARPQPGRYVSVRFGNVLGSRGSVICTSQIERGGPVTITHPEVERFFMLIPEACQLVLEAAVTGADGDVLVLDTGEPVRIVEVARTLIRRSGRVGIDIVYTGLRPGERLSDDLFSDDEYPRATAHRLISSVRVPAIGRPDVEAARIHHHASARVDTPRIASWLGQTGSGPRDPAHAPQHRPRGPARACTGRMTAAGRGGRLVATGFRRGRRCLSG